MWTWPYKSFVCFWPMKMMFWVVVTYHKLQLPLADVQISNFAPTPSLRHNFALSEKYVLMLT